MRKFISFGPSLVVLAAVALVLGLAPAWLQRVHVEKIGARVEFAESRLASATTLIEQLNQINRDVADSVLPGVVHIQVRGRAAVSDALEDGAGERPQPRRFGAPRASAAGWFYNDEGFIVTNAHVVSDAETVRVELFDGRVRDATVVGFDPRTDIAVIHVDDVAGVAAPKRDSSRAVHVGDRVFAFGSPFGIKHSMSQGIVSGLGRSEAASLVGLTGGYTNFIQTDAAMNPGNSGGPLADSYGQVIGMSTAIANHMEFSFNDRAPQGQNAGIGFAIPIETIEAVVKQLIEGNVVVRGYLGVLLEEIRPGFRRAAFDGSGVVVTQVVEGHPADKAGLRVGDIVTMVAGHPCTNADVLRSLVSIRAPGSTVPLEVWRDGSASEMMLRVGGAYFAPSAGGEDLLRYVEGSENMNLTEVRKRIDGPDSPARLD